MKRPIYAVGKAITRVFTLLVALVFVLLPDTSIPGFVMAGVDTTTFLNDAKIVYGALQNQIAELAVVMNLFGDGGKFGKPINNIGIRGYTFAARMSPNYNMGYRKEGVVGVGSAGNQGLKQSTVALKYAYVPISITGQAENLTKGEGRAFMQAKALEAKFDMEDIVKHVNVVVAGAQRGGALAVVSASGVGTTTCSTVGNLPGALFIRPNMPLDSGPVGGGVNSTTGVTATAVNYTTNVVSTTGGTMTVGHSVYLAGESCALADFPLTAEGFVSLISNTQVLQGLDPSQQDQVAWQSFIKDAGAVQISPLIMTIAKMFVKNRSGKNADMYICSSAQIANYVNAATATIKYDVYNGQSGVGKKALDLGFATFSFAGLPMIEEPDLQPDRFHCGTQDSIKKFEAVPLSMADDEAGTWTRISGASGIADAVQGLLRWYHQLGILCRAEWATTKNLTVPTDFTTNPTTLA